MFAENLQRYMEKAGLSNTDLGKMLGVSEVAVSRWKSGQRNPRKDMIDKLCGIFKCTPNDLLTDRNDVDLYIEVLRLVESLNTSGLNEVKKKIETMEPCQFRGGMPQGVYHMGTEI